jgi:hypothetical protein
METQGQTTTTTDGEITELTINQVAELLGRSERQAQRILKEQGIEGRYQDGQGNKKFYPEPEIRQLSFRIGSDPAIMPVKHELTLKNFAGAALQKQVQDLQTDLGRYLDKIEQLNQVLGQLKYQAGEAETLKRQVERFQTDLEQEKAAKLELQRDLFQRQATEEARHLVRRNTQLVSVATVLMAVILLLLISPVIAHWMTPVFAMLSRFFTAN